MKQNRHGADRVHHGEAALGDAQADNPPDAPDMTMPDAAPLDADVEYHGEARQPPELGNDDPAPDVP